MSAAYYRARAGAIAAGLIALGACVSATPVGPPARVGPAVSNAAVDASYDWHVLVIAPFGMLLKESPLALHEVLLFHDDGHSSDEGHGSADVENRDCYATDTPPPRFVGRQPVEYLLCFDHDRLNRIETSVHLTAADAVQVFSQACGLWLKSSASTPSPDHCEGRDGDIGFSAHLGLEPSQSLPGDSASGQSIVPLSMTLVGAADAAAAVQ
jgi:hypothetical protein